MALIAHVIVLIGVRSSGKKREKSLIERSVTHRERSLSEIGSERLSSVGDRSRKRPSEFTVSEANTPERQRTTQRSASDQGNGDTGEERKSEVA